jgi:hypothetical protein
MPISTDLMTMAALARRTPGGRPRRRVDAARSTIKPPDADAIVTAATDGHVVTIETHIVVGGPADAVASTLAG